jgi:hypothetical protein
MFNNTTDNSEKQKREKQTRCITFTIADIDAFRVKNNKISGLILSVKFYFS